MNMTLSRFGLGSAAGFLSTMVMPVGILVLVAMMVLPLPAFLLDTFFCDKYSGITIGTHGGFAHLPSA